MSKIPVYLMPGLAASSSIFERIDWPEDMLEIVLLDWVLPKKEETLSEYAFRMSKNIKHQNPVLVGVSFGGVLVQEIAQHIPTKKVIIISSVTSNTELPLRMKLAKSTKAYKLLPTGLLQDIELLTKFAFGDTLKKKLKLYEKYLHMRNKEYLDWAIEQMVCWQRSKSDPNIIHIHGDLDEVFPIKNFKNLKNFIIVKGGTHAMILSKYKWFSVNLPKIIIDK